MKVEILREEEGFLAVNKPAGVLSQGDKSGDEELASLVKKSRTGAESFLAPVHRLDRNTSGILLLARNKEAARDLSELIRGRDVDKIYLALVKGDPGDKGRIDLPLSKDEGRNQTHVDEDGQEAVTDFRRLQKMGNSSLVEATLVTGRSHQVRAHFAAKGHALLGDRKYGKKPWTEIFSRPALHAYRLVFSWQGEKVDITCPLPQDMKDLLVRLGGQVF